MPQYKCLIDGGCGKDDLNSEKGCKIHASRMHGVKKDAFNFEAMFEEVGGEPVKAETVTEEPAPETVVPPVQVPAPVQIDPSKYSMIPPGSEILVDTASTGTVWRQDKNEGGGWDWTAVPVRGIRMKVLDRQPNQGEWLLFCRPEGASAQWAILEKLVLNGQMALLSVPEGTPTVDISQFAPEPNVAGIDPESEREEALAEMRPTLKEYAEKSKASCTATKAFNKLKKISYEDVLACVKNFGLLNEDEKNKSAESRILYEEGFKFEAYLTNEQEIDEWSEHTAGWLQGRVDKNPEYEAALYTAVDYNVLKKLIDDGYIIPEEIKHLRTKKVVPGEWRLRVDVDETQK